MERLMLMRAFLQLYRTRLLSAMVAVGLMVMFAHMWISAEGPGDVGVFWHHFCGCPPEARDVGVMFATLNVMSLLVGVILSMNLAPNTSVGLNSRRFLLTRPVSRGRLNAYPFVLALVAVAVLPVGAIAVLLGWLKLVHAPTLGHLLATLELMPAAAGLGMHPSLASVMEAVSFGRRYVAAMSVGMAAFVVFAAARWGLASPRDWVRRAASLMTLLIFLPQILPGHWGIFQGALLIAGDKADVGYIPSTVGIVVHWLVVGAFFWGTGWVLREAEV